ARARVAYEFLCNYSWSLCPSPGFCYFAPNIFFVEAMLGIAAWLGYGILTDDNGAATIRILQHMSGSPEGDLLPSSSSAPWPNACLTSAACGCGQDRQRR